MKLTAKIVPCVFLTIGIVLGLICCCTPAYAQIPQQAIADDSSESENLPGSEWNCSYCGAKGNTGNICPLCGNQRSASQQNAGNGKNTRHTDDIFDCGKWENITQIALGETYILGLSSDGTVLTAGTLPEWFDVSSWDGIEQIVSAGFAAGLKRDGTVVTTSYNSDTFHEVESWRNIERLSGGPNFSTLCGFHKGSDGYEETGGQYWYSAKLFGNSLKDVHYGPLSQVAVIDNNDVALYDNDGHFWGIVTDVAALGDDVVLHTDGTVEMLRHYNDGSGTWKNIKKIATCALEYPDIAIAAIDDTNKLYLNITAEKVFGDISISDAHSAVISENYLGVVHTDGSVSIYRGEELNASDLQADFNEMEDFESEYGQITGNRFRLMNSNGKQILELIDLDYDGTYIKAYFSIAEKSEYSEDYGQNIKLRTLTLQSYEEGTYTYKAGDSYWNGTFTLSGDQRNILYRDEDYEYSFSFSAG